MLGIGIDTGGTCTDAVIYDFSTGEILGSGKALTTKSNLEIGIANALDALPSELVEKAESIVLSTTLATNACLENKGARAKLLLLGFQEDMMDHLRELFSAYGMRDMTRFVTMDARPEGIFSQPVDPDWEDLRKHAREYFADCDSVGVVQVYPRANGGRFELTALKILREELTLPITISYDISNETDVLKACAGTLINSMLIPLISEFMTAIEHVCLARGLKAPISIILSNGTMVPAATARQIPVETILCGPAASVVGGSALAGEKDGIIVDMGGTTTDIAVVRDNIPMPAEGGIRIGQWKTMVQGIYVDTIALGGDSSIVYRDYKLSLDAERVIPLSVLAASWDHVLPTLKDLALRRDYISNWDYEFFVLVHDISDVPGYTENERKICRLLRNEPLTAAELARKMGTWPQFLASDRLVTGGVLLRSGLTPTDMMILNGDFDLYGAEAARTSGGYLAHNMGCSLEELPGMVYELVERKMYDALARLILRQQFPKNAVFEDPKAAAPVLDALYRQARLRRDDPEELSAQESRLVLTTRMPLIGVGAPIHIFLPRVAELLGTRAVVPGYAGVANALGAVVSRKRASVQLKITAVYENTVLVGFALPVDGERKFVRTYEDAVACGKEAILRAVRSRARQHGIPGEPRIELTVRDSRVGHRDDGLILGVDLFAVATEA